MSEQDQNKATNLSVFDHEGVRPLEKFKKDNSLVFMAYGDGKKAEFIPISLMTKRGLDALLKHTNEIQNANGLTEPPSKIKIRAEVLMKTLGIKELGRLRQILDSLHGTPVRLNMFGAQAKRHAKELLNQASGLDPTGGKDLNLEEVTSVTTIGTLLAYTRISSASERPEFQLNQYQEFNEAQRNGESDSIPGKANKRKTPVDWHHESELEENRWRADDMLIIDWGEPVKAAYKAKKSIYVLTDFGVKERIQNKTGYSLYDILKSEVFTQGVHRANANAVVYTQSRTVTEWFQILCSDSSSSNKYYRCDPRFNKNREPYKSSGVMDGGFRFFKRDVLVPACESITQGTEYEVDFIVEKGRSPYRKMYFSIRIKPDANVIEENLRPGFSALKKLNKIRVQSLTELAQVYSDEVLLAAYEIFIENEMQYAQQNKKIAYPLRYIKGICQNLEEASRTTSNDLFEAGSKNQDKPSTTGLKEPAAKQDSVPSVELRIMALKQFNAEFSAEELWKLYKRFQKEAGYTDLEPDLALKALSIRTEFVEFVKNSKL